MQNPTHTHTQRTTHRGDDARGRQPAHEVVQLAEGRVLRVGHLRSRGGGRREAAAATGAGLPSRCIVACEVAAAPARAKRSNDARCERAARGQRVLAARAHGQRCLLGRSPATFWCSLQAGERWWRGGGAHRVEYDAALGHPPAAAALFALPLHGPPCRLRRRGASAHAHACVSRRTLASPAVRAGIREDGKRGVPGQAAGARPMARTLTWTPTMALYRPLYSLRMVARPSRFTLLSATCRMRGRGLG